MSLPITEDTPPDMLAGSMDLKVVLPDGHSVKMSVQRGTPMMDLLVQATTAHCLSPGDYSLQPMGDKGVLPFKPSTPIGALDAFTVKIVEKKLQTRGRAPQVPQAFLNTFRLQVHLPRSQLFVLRVTPDVSLSEIMTHICTEKNLNMDKYEFRNPGNLEEVLELDKTLGDYKLQELSMMSKGNRTVTGLMSSADMINVKSSKHRQNSVCDSSLSSGSFGSRSGSPIPPINVVAMPPQPPMRKKRRPAPKPPTFAEKERKDQTTGSVLISHSRESSDSSGYHEASVLSESPTHGGPAGRIENDSPPDTLPRRSKLPPSQSFTNLTSIQPAPKGRLTSSVSNTSLNSTGFSRKKRAPPPPPTRQISREDKIKSSTLPTSAAEERRNGPAGFNSETSFSHYKADSPVEQSNAKVQTPVEKASSHETKASSEDVPGCLDVDVRLPPKPKPRTSIPKTAASQRNLVNSGGRKLEDVPENQSGAVEEWKSLESSKDGAEPLARFGVESRDGPERGENGLLAGTSEPSNEEADGCQDQDSINWEYQLPPPPTDFRDRSSPNCTEFGTITITPEVLENVNGDPGERFTGKTGKSAVSQTCLNEAPPGENNENHRQSEKKFFQNKSVVMNELTNILNGNKKFKEKSLSVSNLYIKETEAKDFRNGLNYSKSFTTEPTSKLDNFKLATYQSLGGNNKKLSASNELIQDNEITYRNYKNLEKSSSLECIQGNGGTTEVRNIIGRTEDGFRKPVAPVQKKLKVAKRSASSVGANHKRNSEGSQNGDWAEDENITILRQQFLEFLQEKKLNNDLKMKSLDVIRNILPELEKDGAKNHVSVVVNQNNDTNSQSSRNAQSDKGEEKVKIVEVKVKNPPQVEETSSDVVIRQENKVGNPAEGRRESLESSPVKKQEVGKRYSYQGPPSINFGTWGERPKTTRIIIKDEDYVTREKVTERKSELNKNGETLLSQKPKEVKKPAQIIIKKPGVLSRYEMFSALPKRKEVSSLELVHMEDEERKRRAEKSEAKEFSRVPVVCGMELKKEFKSPAKSSFPPPEPEIPVQQQETTKPKHSVSVYVNGNQETERNSNYFVVPKRNSVLMPVVKGFRQVEDVGGHQGAAPGVVQINCRKTTAQETAPVVKRQLDVPVPPPPPPSVSLVKLRNVSSAAAVGGGRQKPPSQDPRSQLLDEIRNFGGLRKLNRSRVY